MKNDLPTWPQTLLICALGAAFCLLGYILSRMHGGWSPVQWSIAGLLAIVGSAFLLTIFLFYLRPQYGNKAFPLLLFLLLGHTVLVAFLWRMGMAR